MTLTQTEFAFTPADPRVTATEAPRLSRQCSAILERLKQGPALNVELNDIAFRYSARVHEIRKAGYDVAKSCVDRKRGVFRYELKEWP